MALTDEMVKNAAAFLAGAGYVITEQDERGLPFTLLTTPASEIAVASGFGPRTGQRTVSVGRERA